MMNKDQLLQKVVSWMRKNKEYPSRINMEDVGVYDKDIRREFRTLEALHKAVKKVAPEVWEMVQETEARTDTKARVVETYVDLSKKLNRPPTQSELVEQLDIGRTTVKDTVGSMEKLHALAVELLPDEMEELFTSDSFTPQQFQKNLKAIKKHKRFFLTTAVSGCRVPRKHWESLQQFCDETDRLPIFLPIADPARPNFQNGVLFFDTVLKDQVMVFDDFSLNDNCYVSNIKTSAKQIVPTTGLTRIGRRSGTFIYASPKLSLESVANAHDTPLMVITTGAITEPDYSTDRYMSDRTAYIATHDHAMAGVVIDIIDEKVFHWRPVEFDEKGRLVDLGKMYDGKSVQDTKCVVYLPDGHVAQQDQEAMKAFDQILTVLEPHAKLRGDSFDGLAINGHNRRKHVTRAKLKMQLDLEKEINEYVQSTNNEVRNVDKFYEIASNHNDRIEWWLEDGGYVKDPVNYRIGHEMAQYLLDGKNPLEEAARKRGLSKKVVFLKRDQQCEIYGVELGYHGDIADHGSRGNLEKFDKALGKCVVGHSHVPRIFRRAWSVGTSSHLREGWNKGPQAWCHSLAVVYENGSRQLIHVIKGRWRD